MSITHMSLVLDHYDGPAHLKLTLLILADHANSEGECYPSYDTIAARACCSRRTAITNVQKLIAEGYVEYVEKGGAVFDRFADKWVNASNLYRVIESSLTAQPNLRKKPKTTMRRNGVIHRGPVESAPDFTPGGDVDDTPSEHEGGDADFTLITKRTIINNHQRKTSVDNLTRGLKDAWTR